MPILIQSEPAVDLLARGQPTVDDLPFGVGRMYEFTIAIQSGERFSSRLDSPDLSITNNSIALFLIDVGGKLEERRGVFEWYRDFGF